MILSFRRGSALMSGLVLGLTLGGISAAWANLPESGWSGDNAPGRLGQNFDVYFDPTGTRIPFEARLPNSRMPYADTYWPHSKGSIAYRWNSFPWVDPYVVEMARRYRNYLPTQSERARMNDDEREVLRQLDAMTPAQRAEIVGMSEAIFKYDSKTRYRHPSLKDARAMSPAELARLSPTEKYDLARGKYDYPFTNSVLGRKTWALGSRIYTPYRAYWEGICHGWAPAATNHAEPLPVNYTNPDGIVVPFGSADVKALLDYMYATVDMSVQQLGDRCGENLERDPSSRSDSECADVNAGSFHIVLTNFIALRKQSFVADTSRGHEVWNYPIYAYSFKVMGEAKPARGAAKGTARMVRIQTTIRFPSDDQRLPPQWNATVGKEEMRIPDTLEPLDPRQYENVYRYEEATYDYWLELDRDNRIIGGMWAGLDADRPDFLWTKKPLRFVGEYEALNRIYIPAFRR